MPNSAMPAPVTYEIDGVQYLAVVTGAGGPTLTTGASQYSYARQPGRVVVFALNGKATLPSDPGRAPPANPTNDLFTPAQISSGEALYARNCARCHSARAASANIVADLRGSGALPNKALWQRIVHDGLLENLGMVGWSSILGPNEVEDIRAYVSDRAQALKDSGDPAPARAGSLRCRSARVRGAVVPDRRGATGRGAMQRNGSCLPLAAVPYLTTG
jgi:quinohemoprotein ethanol dehydrogenase